MYKTMTLHGTMTHKIQTSTTCIGNFIDTGLYETYLGELWGGIPYATRGKADDEIGKCAVDYIEDALWTDVFPSDYDDDFEVMYTGTYHPKWDNFETDSTLFDFAYTDELCEYMLGYAAMNRDNFEEFLEKKYTSRDGYVSFTPNNWDDWYDGYIKDDFRCVSALLYFMLIMCSCVNIDDNYNFVGENSYQHGFIDSATQIISEGYTPYDYAVKYDNGMVVAVFSDYDENGELFNCYLLDADGKMIKHEQVFDEYNAYNRSAFAVFQYGEGESVLDDDLQLYHMHSEPCVTPDIPEREL